MLDALLPILVPSVLGMPKEKYDPPDPRRMYTIMSSEEAANGKKSYWAELEISGESGCDCLCTFVFCNCVPLITSIKCNDVMRSLQQGEDRAAAAFTHSRGVAVRWPRAEKGCSAASSLLLMGFKPAAPSFTPGHKVGLITSRPVSPILWWRDADVCATAAKQLRKVTLKNKAGSLAGSLHYCCYY